jgi:NitT/TauT family transport system substrate-binding protein
MTRALTALASLTLAALAACGGASAPAGGASAPASAAAASKPAAPASAAASPSAASAKPAASASGAPAASKPGGSAAASGPAGKEPMRGGYVSVSAYSTLPTITKSAGLFDKYGIDMSLTFIAPAALTAALTAGKDLDVGYGSAESTATVDAQGGDLVIIGAMQQGGIFKISANPPIKSIAELKGQKVAITSKGSTTDLLLRQLLQANKMVPDTDVSIVSIPEQPAMVAAMKAGQIVAAVMSEPATSMAVAQGANVIYDQSKLSDKAVQLPVLVKRGYIPGHRDLLKRFLMANMEGIHLTKTRPAEAAPYAAAFLKNDDQAIVQKSLQAVSEVTGDDMDVPLSAVADAIKISTASLPEAAKLKPEDLVDTSLLQEIKASGFIDKLTKG